MPDFTHVLTERLDLRPVEAADLDALYPITSDPRTWEHEPEGRHTAPETTRAWIQRAAARWRDHGLSYWTIRLRSPTDATPSTDATPGDGHAGEAAEKAGTLRVIGVGGVQRRRDGSWNLFYRLAPEAWGRGYATEMSRAAIGAAHAADPDVPVVAWILDHNQASLRVAGRLGLVDQGLRVDDNDGMVRRTFADRSLPPTSVTPAS